MELRVLLARCEALPGLEEERTAVRKRWEEGEQSRARRGVREKRGIEREQYQSGRKEKGQGIRSTSSVTIHAELSHCPNFQLTNWNPVCELVLPHFLHLCSVVGIQRDDV